MFLAWMNFARLRSQAIAFLVSVSIHNLGVERLFPFGTHHPSKG